MGSAKPLSRTLSSKLEFFTCFNKNNEMYKIETTFNQLPLSLNRALRTNRFKSNQKNKVWDLLVLGKVAYRRPPQPLKKARIKIVRHFYRTLDYDGLVGSLKPVVDAFVSAGILESDSWNVLGVWDVSQEFVPKSQGGFITVTIEEITPP